MSTEHLLREFYNEMYRVHAQPGNVYDIGDHLCHLTVRKHLDQDPLIRFREAFRWVDQSGARLIADAGCGYGGFAVFVARQAPILAVDGYTLPMCNKLLPAGIGTPAAVEITGVVAEL
jgi:hypothetical protein